MPYSISQAWQPPTKLFSKMKAGDLDELKSTAGYWFTHGGGAKAARGV